MSLAATPELCGIVVNWYGEHHLQRLVDAWPDDDDLALLVVDNGSKQPLPPGVPSLIPGRNLGFAGAVNLALAETEAPLILIMNSDVYPRPGAVEALRRGLEIWPDAAGVAPRLEDAAGTGQFAWQLRDLPTLTTLLLQAMLLPVTGDRRTEPAPGATIPQPAAAALCLRREALERLGGLDDSFYPAWFEDVDLARRLENLGEVIRYCPASVFGHDLGSSIPHLGYGSFLSIYYANLVHYLAKHYGRFWAAAARFLLLPASLLRLVLLPVRCPRRARSRPAAARGLLQLLAGAATGWPQKFTPPRPADERTDPEAGRK
jgi:GT2 family glycosyltransferase